VGTHDDLVTALGLAVQEVKARGVTQINSRTGPVLRHG
jgi:hypothetical protein